MRVTVRTQGFREIDKALGDLGKATAKNVLRRVARAELDPLADQAAGRAPELTGRLAFSISVSERGTRRAEWYRGGGSRLTAGGFRSDPRTSIVMAMGPAAGAGSLSYATFAEFGTIDTPAHPFMRPVWDAGAHRMLDSIKSRLWAEIERAAARAARKAARQARG